MASIGEMVCGSLTGGAPGSAPAWFGYDLGYSWAALCVISMLVSLLIMLLANMLAQFLRHQALLAWTKFELFQVFATMGLFIWMGAIVWGMCGFDMGMLDARYDHINVTWNASGMATMYDVAESYFIALQKIGYLLFAYLTWVVKALNLLAKIVWLSVPLGFGIQDSPLESLGQVNGVFFFIVGGFFTSLLMLWVQMRVLDYMAICSLYYLLPFGIFFRSFEPTRKFGGALMGIAMTFFFFYPMVLVINDYIAYQPMDYMMNSGPDPFKDRLKHADEQADPETSDMVTPEEVTYTDRYETDVRTGNLANLAQMGASVTNGTFVLLKPIMLYFIAAVLLPVINFIVLVEIARALTKLLGEEVDVSNITRMI